MKKILLITIALAAAYWAYGHFMPRSGPDMMGGGMPVSVAEVIQRDVQEWSEFSGRLTAVDTVEVRPRVSGNIDSVHFKDGAMVKKGDLLFVIDPRPYEAALQSAQARATLAESELQRASSLISSKAIPQRDFDQRKNAAAVARADLTRARLDLGYTQVKSPIDGRVGRVEITEGNLVEAGMNAPVLTTVVSSTPIYADFEIDEATYLRYARELAASQKSAADIPVAMMLGENGILREGHVQAFDNQLNTASGTIRVRAVLDNADGLLVPGLFARLKMGSPAPTSALLITDRAIGTDQNKKFVLVVGADNSAEHRTVTLGGMADNLRIVTEGLKPGEKIIVSGTQRVMMPGQPVTPEIVPMEERMPDKSEQGAVKEQ